MKIVLKKMHLENFKKFKNLDIDFGNITKINAKNYSGKSSIADAFAWVLWNKSSTGNAEGKQFKPRRYDKNMKPVERVDVVVELTLMVDDVETIIKKVQRQNWVRHAGDSVDTYEGDSALYFWDGLKVSATEHATKVKENLVPEDVFSYVTNVAAFTSMKEKDQRAFLVDKIAKITEDDIFAMDPQFEKLKEDKGKFTVEKFQEKLEQENKKLKEQNDEFPVRIDEAKKSIVEEDFSEKESLVEKYKNDIAELEEKIADTSKAYQESNEIQMEIQKLSSDLNDVKYKMDRELDKEKAVARQNFDEAERDFDKIQRDHSYAERNLEDYKAQWDKIDESLKVLREEYKDEMSKVFDECSCICPTCGQEYPEEKKAELKATFESNKANKIDSINSMGKNLSNDKKNLSDKMEQVRDNIESLKKQKIDMNKKEQELHDTYVNLPKEPDYSSNDRYSDIKLAIDGLTAKRAAIDTSDVDKLKANLMSQKMDIQNQMEEILKELGKKDNIEESKKRVEKLESEYKICNQTLADKEKQIEICKKFTKTKMDLLSERINPLFKKVSWKLFDKQKNGKTAETCVCIINGSPYGDNTTSTTERMMAGMDIISTLQDVFDVKAPIFLDDADLYNDWNIPTMDSQLIELCVSSDDEIVVEVGAM